MTEIAVAGIDDIVDGIVGLEHIAEVHAEVLDMAHVTLEPKVVPFGEGSVSDGCSPSARRALNRDEGTGSGGSQRAPQPKSSET